MARSTIHLLLFITLLTLAVSCTEENVIEDALTSNAPILQEVYQNVQMHEVQVLYVQIDRDRKNQPKFTEYAYRVDDNKYFYPASTVKMPVAILALDKLNMINKPGLDRNTRMQIDSVRYPQSAVLLDSTSANGLPSVGHYVHKIFLVSDNDAYNRLYEFVGQNAINDRLRELGISNTRLIHRLSDFRFGPEENRFTNPVTFFSDDTFVYSQPEVFADQRTYPDPDDQVKGVAHITAQGDLVQEPFDFSQKNFFPLHDQVEVLKRVVFPDEYTEDQQFNLSDDDRRFVLERMSMFPGESEHPRYKGEDYFDGYVKFLMYGDTREPIPSSIRIFNKVGWAYGYLTDCAYIVDFENNIEFILAATIHTNANQTYNDGVYEEDEIAIPFLAELGRQVYQYELSRPRNHVPDLSAYKLNYVDE